MRLRRARRAPLALLALALGCATWSHEPGRLLEQGRTALAQQDLGAAYQQLTRIRTDYPRSAESRAAFPFAARAFQGLHAQHRYSGRDPAWLPQQTAFMFEWLASFFEGDAFPRAEVEALLLGMPRAFFAEYQAFAASRPTLARWRLEATDDNGLLDAIQVEPAR